MELILLLSSYVVVFGVGYIYGGYSFRKKLEKEFDKIIEKARQRLGK